MTEATSVTNDGNRVFTLFPKLPIVLRLKIWKQTLPGPRVVRINTWEMLNGESRAVLKRYASLNASINITTVCYESRTVAIETYDRFPNEI